MQKVPYCFPIIGGRKVEHLLSNIEALDISLSHEQIAFLESVIPFDPGFPNTMIVRFPYYLDRLCLTLHNQGNGRVSDFFAMAAGTVVEKKLLVEPIRPTKIK